MTKKNPQDSSPSDPIINVQGDYIQGDKFDGDKINGDKVSGDKQAVEPPSPATNNKRALVYFLIATLGILLIGVFARFLFLGQSQDEFIFQVRVQNQADAAPIANAQITLDIKGEDVPRIEYTDTNGTAIFSIPVDLAGSLTNLTVIADGHQIKNQVTQVKSDQLPTVINLYGTP